MTERLSDLLAREADALDVPPPPAYAVLEHGRTIRRRRRGAAAGATATLAAAVLATTLLVAGGADEGVVEPASPAPELGAVFAIGDRVFLDGGARSVTVGDTAVKSLYYTSAGVVVRHGDNPYSDGGGPQRLSLVAADGTVTRLSVETEGVVHSADPAEPYLGWAEVVGGTVTAVALDVETDEEVARVPLPAHSGGFAPTWLDDGTLYVADPEAGQTFVIDLAAPGAEPGSPVTVYDEVAGGRAVIRRSSGSSVVDLETGEALLRSSRNSFIDLSPDGRWARVVDYVASDSTSAVVLHDLEDGTEVTPATPPGLETGWSADGSEVFTVGADGTVTTCTVPDGSCETAVPDLPVLPDERSGQQDDPTDDLRLGGATYES